MYKFLLCDGNVSWKDNGDRWVHAMDLVLEACVDIHGSTRLFTFFIGCIPVFKGKFCSLKAKEFKKMYSVLYILIVWTVLYDV